MIAATPLPPGRTNRRRGFDRAALLLVLAAAFLLQTLSWAARLPAMAAAADGQLIEICVADGLTSIMVDADGQPVTPASDGESAGQHGCPLCPLIGGLFVAPDFIGAPAPSHPPRVAAGPVLAIAEPPARIPSDIWARGPPAPARA